MNFDNLLNIIEDVDDSKRRDLLKSIFEVVYSAGYNDGKDCKKQEEVS